MWFHVLHPEVAGGRGANTLADSTQHPPKVHRLHYEFDGWLGDELLETFPCFIVTQSLADRLRASGLGGFELRSVEVTTSEQFRDLYGEQCLPHFEWLHVTGTAAVDDFGLTRNATLVVSDAALSVLQEFALKYCDIEAMD